MGNELTTVDWESAASEYAKEEKYVGGQLISVRGGSLSIGDEELPGGQMCVVVLDSIRENTYYTGRWDPDDVKPPRCYAFGRTDDEMVPHLESMRADMEYFEPQAEECLSCPMNEWGSADTGRGKACQNRRRIAVIPAGLYTPIARSRDFDLELFEDEEHYAACDMAFMKIPVTSTKNWAKYVNTLSSTYKRPPFGMVTRVYVEPDAGNQYSVHFEPITEIPDSLASTIFARHEQARDSIIRPYAPPTDTGKGGRKSGHRR